MKHYTLTFILLLSGYVSMGQSAEINYHKVVISSSAITIFGETNVNRFECSLEQTVQSDFILVKNIWSNEQLEFEGLKLTYPIEAFDCGIQAMNADFQELLKAEEHPMLTLQLNAITLLPHNDTFELVDVISEIKITIAGIEKEMEVTHCEVQNHSEAHLTLSGKKSMQMTDFAIDPPVKFLGMVKVSNDIRIEFEIAMIVAQYKK